jgi:hypothetical protein
MAGIETDVEDLISQFYSNITEETRREPGNPAAEWRLRKKRGLAIENRLKEIGPFALLSVGSLLVGLDYTNTVVQYKRLSNWRSTLKGSQVFEDLSVVARGQLTGAKYSNYRRLESSIQSLGNMICLSVRDMNDESLLKSFYALKLWAITNAFPSDRTLDRVVEYFKWLAKVCQALFLGQKPPDVPTLSCFDDHDGHLRPFAGPLQFVDEFYQSGRRRRQMDTAEARALAQLGSLSRALDYPSKEQIITDLEQSVNRFTEAKTSDTESLARYRKGLIAQYEALGRPKPTRTHVSLVANACLESSRSQGGRSKYLVHHTRAYTDAVIDFEVLHQLSGRVDQFGRELVSKLTIVMAEELLKHNVYLRNPTYGDFLFVKAEDLEIVWQENLCKQTAPKELGHLLNLTASALILEMGHYKPRPSFCEKIMSFPANSRPVFHLTERLRVRAGVSIESGLKSRLATSAQAAFAHLSQLPANALRGALSKDPFLKVGFMESEKLWEVLKAYRSAYAE